MAGPTDNRFIEEIGYLVSEFFALRSKDYFSAVQRFWADNKPEHWQLIWRRNEPRAGMQELLPCRGAPLLTQRSHPSLPVLEEVGWFVYQKACSARDPEHRWNSPLDSKADAPFTVRRNGKRFFTLPERDLEIIEKRANRTLLWRGWREGAVSWDKASAQARDGELAPFPAELVFDTSGIPKQPWLTYCEAIVALVTGEPSDFSVNDFRMSIDVIQQAKHMLLHDGAYKGLVCLHGKRNGTGDPTPILSARFSERISSSLMLNQMTFEGSETWTNVSVDVRSFKKWIKVQASRKQRKDSITSVALPPAQVTAQVRKKLKPLIDGWNRDGPFPTLPEICSRLKIDLGFDPPEYIVRKVRKDLCGKAGLAAALKPGPREKGPVRQIPRPNG